MAQYIKSPSKIKAAGNVPKVIEEHVGRVNSDSSSLSIARMKSPEGWIEPGQTPDFDEYTVVLKGLLKVETFDGTYEVREGETLITKAGKWVKYSTPNPDGAEYISVCLPAFSPETVHRDE